ncbi:MAG: PilZ domain-containing protein [Deltaproteobacteria bacterium]|nr:PilZ domain-containing protein [Deltaproteobacteria bacterium]
MRPSSHQDDVTRRARESPPARPPSLIRARALAAVLERICRFLAVTEDKCALHEAARRAEARRLDLASPTPEVREFARIEARGLAEFAPSRPRTRAGRSRGRAEPESFRVGRLVDVGAGGLGISTVHPLEAGASTRVRVTEPSTGRVYAFGCVVVWSRTGDESAMGVRFVGPAALLED